MTLTPTGRREERDGQTHVVFERTFRAPIDDVWAAITEPERLERWIGTWSGDPASGRVDFRMTAEAEDAPVEVFEIRECDEPRLLVVDSRSPDDPDVVWHLRLALAEADGVTTLTFSQSVPGAEMAESVGPGWEYYLDRLVAAETGADVAAVDWDAYYPSQSGHYRELFS